MENYSFFTIILSLCLWVGAVWGNVVIFGGSKNIHIGWKIAFGICNALVLAVQFVTSMNS